MGIYLNLLVRETYMKKLFATIITFLMAIVMCFSMVACNITSINSEKDNKQVVAEVNVLGENYKTKKITKQDMIIAYYSYGYYYVYYGYSQAEVFEMIIENLIGTEVMLQTIMDKYEKNDSFAKDESKAKYTLERYLGSEEIRDAKYNTLLNVNQLIDSYMVENPTYQETLGGTVRTVPTGATNEVEDEDKDKYLEKGVYDVAIGEERHTAYNKFIKFVKDAGFIGNYSGNIEDTDYYQDTYKGNLETVLLQKYNEEYVDAFRKDAEFSSLEARYAEMYEAQKTNNSDATSFEEALSNATADSPVVYTPYGGYGYVYNLLLGASATQTEDITAYKKEITDNAKFLEARKAVLQATVVKDLRSSWILSGYDFDGEKFTGDYTFTETNSLPFQGSVTKVKEATEDEKAVYSVDSINEFGLDEFISFMNDYLYGESVGAKVDDPSIYYKANVASGTATEYDEKINELLFAFSTDDGSLNTYKGYVINPEKDLGSTDKWVKEFANAGRELLSMGGNSYMVVASDYGYHVMFYSAVCKANQNYETLKSYLDSLDATKGGYATWEEYFDYIVENWEDFEDSDLYLYKLMSTHINASSAYSKHETETINAVRYDETKVKVYEGRYKNLLG